VREELDSAAGERELLAAGLLAATAAAAELGLGLGLGSPMSLIS
jgi:hypothetical protein